MVIIEADGKRITDKSKVVARFAQALKDERDGSSSSVRSLQSKLSAAQSSVAAATAQNERLRGQNKGLQRQLAALQTERAALQSKLAASGESRSSQDSGHGCHLSVHRQIQTQWLSVSAQASAESYSLSREPRAAREARLQKADGARTGLGTQEQGLTNAVKARS